MCDVRVAFNSGCFNVVSWTVYRTWTRLLFLQHCWHKTLSNLPFFDNNIIYFNL